MEIQNETIERNSTIPLYKQIKAIMIRYVLSEHSGYDTPIPTEMEIAEHFHVSRPTVRQAIREMVVEGYLYRISGKGTFVSKPKIEQTSLENLTSFRYCVPSKRGTAKTVVIRLMLTSAGKTIGEKLHVNPQAEVILLERLMSVDDEPLIFVQSYLKYPQCNCMFTNDLTQDSMHQILIRNGIPLFRAARELESIPAGLTEEKYLLMAPGAPVTRLETLACLMDNTPVAYTDARYRGDRNKFSYELKF